MAKKLLKIFFPILLIFLSSTLLSEEGFLVQQKKNERVKLAYKEKEAVVKKYLAGSNISLDRINIMIVAFKEEGKLELYAKDKSDYKKIMTYDICATSGTLGPKSKAGDGQVPEGFYYINRFNPYSTYYLSLGLNYPNDDDRKRVKNGSMGGDIFIHGECVTIGCMPMTNDKIQEIYLMAIQAHASGQEKIPVYVYPFRMTDKNFKYYSEKYKSDPGLIKFWTSLKDDERSKVFF